MITEINESETLTKHISCECRFDKGRFDGKKYISDQWWNNHKYWCECKKFGMLVLVVAKMENIQQVLWWFSDYVWRNYWRKSKSSYSKF